jgi:hypothetical protein
MVQHVFSIHVDKSNGRCKYSQAFQFIDKERIHVMVHLVPSRGPRFFFYYFEKQSSAE